MLPQQLNTRFIAPKFLAQTVRFECNEHLHERQLSFLSYPSATIYRGISTEGSVAHNAIFMPKGSTVVIIRKAKYVNEYQSVINEINELNPIYIDANWSHLLFIPKEPWIGPFFLYANRRMASFLSCRSHFPVAIYIRYVIFYFKTKICARFRKMKLMKEEWE